VGRVFIKEIHGWWVDKMPYGGVKDSGPGREGICHPMKDLSKIRPSVIRDPKP
jgi:acyl-CoA reductase-like NAD-dependent aldehyde dehydrogenase